MIDVDVMRGGEYAANALIYKPLSQTTSEYLHRHLDSTLNSIKGISTSFVDGVRGLYDRFSSSEAIQRAKMLLYGAGMHLSEDVIYPVSYSRYDVNLIMQKYIMACPEVSELYKRNKCYGFQDTYVDPEPGTYGTDRFDYQRVMNGWLISKDKSDDNYFIHYSNSDPEERLSTIDQLAIRKTWDVVNRIIAEGRDPTHPDREKF